MSTAVALSTSAVHKLLVDTRMSVSHKLSDDVTRLRGEYISCIDSRIKAQLGAELEDAIMQSDIQAAAIRSDLIRRIK